MDRIIDLIKKGDTAAFKKLYDHYGPVFKGIIYRYIGDTDTSNDILQEAFIKIFKNISSFSGTGSFEGWMKRIVVNSCLNFVYKENRYKMVSDEFLLNSSAGHWDLAISELSTREIIAIINQLPEGYRIVFNLNVFEGYSHKEIGDILGITPSASRSQLAKAKSRLKHELKRMNIISAIA